MYIRTTYVYTYMYIYLFTYILIHIYTYIRLYIQTYRRTRVYRVEINLEDMSVGPSVLVYNHTASTHAGPFTIALSSSLCHMIPGSCIVIIYYAPVSNKGKCTHIQYYKPKLL